jgi:hypothetical protein
LKLCEQIDDPGWKTTRGVDCADSRIGVREVDLLTDEFMRELRVLSSPIADVTSKINERRGSRKG